MSTNKKIRALYFPYARSLDPIFLKHALLIFDQLLFTDPLERAIREAFANYSVKTGLSGHEKWNSIKDDYAYLEDEGYFERINPFPVVRDYDGLMAQAMISDLHDENFIQLASEFASQDYWGILREKVPPDSLMANAVSFYGTRFWRNPRTITFPRQSDKDYGGFHDFSSPFLMSVAHDYVPVSCGYSINTNLALLLGELQDLVLVTDNSSALRFLNLKYTRANKNKKATAQTSSIIVKRSPEYFQKYSMLGINIADALVPTDQIAQRSFKDLVRFKKNEADAFERFKGFLFELVSQVESEPWNEDLEKEIIKLIDGKVLPESQKMRDQLKTAYEKMFGSLVQKTTIALTPTLAASFLAGLSSGQILTLSTVAITSALTIALPEILELWKDKKENKRNGVNFLVRFAK